MCVRLPTIKCSDTTVGFRFLFCVQASFYERLPLDNATCLPTRHYKADRQPPQPQPQPLLLLLIHFVYLALGHATWRQFNSTFFIMLMLRALRS